MTTTESLTSTPTPFDNTRALIGRGLSFPFTVDGKGHIALTTGDDVVAAIYMITMTAPGERVMRPDFGCEIWDLVYSPVNAATLGQMANAVRQALSRWEPRIEVDDVTVRPQPDDASVVELDVDYKLRTSNDRR